MEQELKKDLIKNTDLEVEQKADLNTKEERLKDHRLVHVGKHTGADHVDQREADMCMGSLHH